MSACSSRTYLVVYVVYIGGYSPRVHLLGVHFRIRIPRMVLLGIGLAKGATIRYIINCANYAWGIGAAGSAFDWQSRGHGFEPRMLHQNERHWNC